MSTEGISYATELPVIQPAQPLHRRSFPICPKCNQSCFKNDGRFVRALNQVYHYQCFVCERKIIEEEEKLFYVNIIIQNDQNQFAPSVINLVTARGFTRIVFNVLSVFPPTLKLLFMNSTDKVIVEPIIHFYQKRDALDFWSVKLAPLHEPDVNELVEFQVAVEKTVNRVWIDLSSFEESAANCISDMLLNAASALYSETIRAANQFAVHLEVLFNALDFIDRQLAQFGQTLNCSREASFVCNQVTQFLQLLDSSQEKSSSTITQDLSSLVTGLAQNLKSLIKIGLSTSLRLEQELDLENTILDFLQHLLALEKKRVWISGKYWFKDAPLVEERILMCSKCKSIISKDYYTCKEKDLQWHRVCFQCSVCSGQIRERDQVSFEQTNEVVCCATPDQTFYTCTYVSFLQHLLYDLKLHLSQLSLPPHKKSVAMSSSEANKENNALLGSKRRKSLLGLLTAKSQKSTETNIHLGQIQSSRKGQDEGVRRTFSIGSNRGVTRKLSQRQPISSLFRRQSKKTQQQARRASVFTVDDRVLSWEPIQTLSLSQDYILRHVAAMTLQPLLAAHFSLDEFLDLLEAEYKVLSPSYSSHHPSALWGKLITHIRAKSTGQEHKIFGAPLSVLVNKDKERMGPKVPALQNVSASLNASFSENASIPIFVKSLITTLLQSDMSVEGVFRKNGNIRQLNILVDSIDQLNDKGLTEKSMNEAIGNMLVKQSPIQLSALLKRYLRELPKPLLTFRFYKLFVQCGKRQDSKRMLHMACCLLPKPNRDTMLMIFSCLKWIGEFSATNRMDIRNLARVIAPSVLYSKPCNNDCQSELRQSAHDEILVVEHLIRYSDDMSTIPSDLILLSIHDIQPSDMSSKYFIKRYTQLLIDKQSKEPNNTREKQKRLSWILGKKRMDIDIMTIKVGIIGTGIFAYRHHRAYQAVGNEKYQVVACANRSKDKALAFAKKVGIPESAVYTDPLDLINDPNVEAVDILLPVQYNKEIIKSVIAAKKHVMFEKPIAANLEDAKEIVKMSQEAKTVVAVSENWSYHPLAFAVANYVQSGGIGEIVNFTYDSARPYNPDSPYHATKWRQNPEHPGGYLSDGCVHDMAHLVPILGRFKSVSAFANSTQKIHVCEDTLATTIRLENGSIGVANFTFSSAGIKKQHLVLHGSKGTIHFINDDKVELFNASGEPVDNKPILSLQEKAPGNGLKDVEGEFSAFYDAVRHQKSLGVSTEEAFHHLAFIVACLESVKTERVVEIQKA